MAAKSVAGNEGRSSLYEPSPRYGHYDCCVDDDGSVCVCLGATLKDDSDGVISHQVEIYYPHSKTWKREKTTGTPPPGKAGGACTFANCKLYTYGGDSGDSPFTSTLNELDTSTLEWKHLSTGIGPMRKQWAGMIAVNKEELALFGGLGIPTSIQPGSNFIEESNETDGRGWTNEFHIFNVTNRTWSSPSTSGSRPPPCSDISFTTVDEDRAVIFGGYNQERGCLNDVYMIDFRNMNWTKIEPGEWDPWPAGRIAHAVCCLGYGGDHPQLVMSGGMNNDCEVLNDVWMFDVASRKWKRLTIPKDVQSKRFYHSLTTVTLKSRLVEAVMFGGSNDSKSFTPISATTILNFEFIVSTKEWTLNVFNNTQREQMCLEIERHHEAYQQALQSGLSIELKYIKLLMLGPPRSGKTSLRKRLVGEIINLNIDQTNQPSTGIAEAHNVVVKVEDEKIESSSILVSESLWTAVRKSVSADDSIDIDEELRLLYRFITQGSIGFADADSVEPSMSNIGSAVTSAVTKEVNNGTETNSFTYNVGRITRFPGNYSKPSETLETVDSEGTVTMTENQHAVSHSEIENAFKAFNKALTLRAGRQQLKVLLEKTILLNMVDTGGQPAFIEMLPMLTVGPALYLIFLRLDQDLKKAYGIQYVSKNNTDVSLGESSYTLQEVIFQVLSSIACFKSDTISESESATNTGDSSATNLQQVSSHKSQAAMLVGTYKDKLEGNPQEVTSKINEIDRMLQEELKEILDTNLFESDRDLLQKASYDQLMFDVDNMTGSEDEVKKIRQRIEKVIMQKFNKYPIPASWLMFGIFIRRMGKQTISLSQCEEIGQRLQVGNVREAIWFLHHCIGILMHYPNVEVLKDVVICDPQIVFDSVTELILNTFTFNNVGNSALWHFEHAGQFRVNDIQKLSKSLKSNVLSLTQLVTLLENLNIIARIPNTKESVALPTNASPSTVHIQFENDVYFMPAILQSAQENELEIFHESVDPAPLIIRFKRGMVPVGVFCACVASLLAQKDLEWKLQIEKPRQCTESRYTLYKNRVTFRVHIDNASYDVTFISKLKQYEVHITLCSPSERPSHNICKHVLETICRTLDHVISKIKDKKYLALSISKSLRLTQSPYELGFQCPLHPRVDHVAVFPSAPHLWFSYFQNNTSLKCLNENIHFDLSKIHVGSSDNQAGNSQILHVQCDAVPKCIEEKYRLWMKPQNVVSHQIATVTVHDSDWATICKYLDKLNQTQIRRLGGELGLSVFSLEKMKLPDEMVTAWLRKQDDVLTKSGRTLTWNVLVKKLENIGQYGIAADIKKDVGMH